MRLYPLSPAKFGSAFALFSMDSFLRSRRDGRSRFPTPAVAAESLAAHRGEHSTGSAEMRAQVTEETFRRLLLPVASLRRPVIHRVK
jgi:hypothetical protein